RYLADASAVELTRNPDALAGALVRLSQDNSAITGGNWAGHLFVINPSGDHSAGMPAPSTEQMRQAAQAWASSAGVNPIPPSQGGSQADYSQLRRQVISAGLAAAGGDAQAAARMQSFIRAVAAAHGEDAASMHIPDFADLAAARRGDRAALARLQAAGRPPNEERHAKSGPTGLAADSFLSRTPRRKERLK